MGGTVAEKSRAFDEWLQRRDMVIYDRYRAQRVVVKRPVEVAKCGLTMGERLMNGFEG